MSKEKGITSTALALPSLDYLLGCSENALHDLELMALNRAATHLQAARLEWEEAIAQREAAGVARWLIENRDRILAAGSRTVEIKAAEFPGEVTITANKKGLDALLGPETPKRKTSLTKLLFVSDPSSYMRPTYCSSSSTWFL